MGLCSFYYYLPLQVFGVKVRCPCRTLIGFSRELENPVGFTKLKKKPAFAGFF
jgi:hypothetical protein